MEFWDRLDLRNNVVQGPLNLQMREQKLEEVKWLAKVTELIKQQGWNQTPRAPSLLTPSLMLFPLCPSPPLTSHSLMIAKHMGLNKGHFILWVREFYNI